MITPPEIQEQISQRETSALKASAPKTAARISTAKRTAAAAQAEAEELEAGTAHAMQRTRSLLTDLGNAKEKRELLASLQATNAAIETEVAPPALADYLRSAQSNDAFALQRFIIRADEAARLAVIAPAVAPAIVETEREVVRLESEISKTATAAGIDLARLLTQLREEHRNVPGSKLAIHFEAGRLEFATK